MDVMNVITRGARRIGRELRKHARLRTARREGLVYVAPNFLYCPDLTPDSVVIDAGCSYEADFSVCLMQRHGVRAFGVDPTRKHQSALRALEARYPGRFVHVSCAIAAADGVVTFHESRTNESGSLLRDHVNVLQDDTTSYDVEAVTVRSLLAHLSLETVDILKLDLEGAEYALLTDIDAAELRPVRQLFVEFHHHAISHLREADSRSLVRRISGFGFRTFSLDDHNYLFYRDR
jgi:FkbM family methyltransferase